MKKFLNIRTKYSLKSSAILLLLFACQTTPAAIVVTDDSGNTVQLAQAAQRIVSLAPHMTENLFAAGAGAQIVGTVDYSDYPENAKKIQRVGGYSRIDLEAVIALKPDLIIAWQSGNTPAHVSKLRALGIPIYVSQPNLLDDIAREIERLGILAGQENSAANAAAQYRARLGALKARYSGQAPVSTFYQIWKQPLSTIGGKQIISSVIELCGGKNVFAQQETLAPVVSVEAVIAANPEAIIASGMGQSRPEWLDDWKRWTRIAAVAKNNLFFVPPEQLQRHTSRILDGAEILCQSLEIARSKR